MNILSINISQNESISRLVDGQLVQYTENFSKDFYFKFGKDGESLDVYIDSKILEEKPDLVIYCSFDRRNNSSISDKQIIDSFQEILGHPKFLFCPGNHHLYHAFNSFNLSSFDESLCIVLDGGGAQIVPNFQEIESIYYFTKDTYKCFYQKFTNIRCREAVVDFDLLKKNIDPNMDYNLSSDQSSGQKFANLLVQLFTDEIKELEKGLIPQDKLNLWSLYMNIVMQLYHLGNEEGNTIADKAKQLHIETRNETIKFIQKALRYQNTKNIVMSGGFILNHINNQEYEKHFSDYNFFFDPLAHDGGTSSGAAFWLNHLINKLNYSYEDLKKLPDCYNNL